MSKLAKVNKADLEIEEEILAASFWENWKWYKELCAIKSPRKFKARENAEKIRQDWIRVQKQMK